MIPARARRAALGLLLAWLAAPPAAADTAPPPDPPCLWSNVGQELAALAASPLEGTWAGYGAAAAFGAGLAVVLRHDLPAYAWIQDHRSPLLDKTMPVATLLGDGLFHVGAMAALYQFGGERDRAIAAMALEGQIGVAAVSLALKAAFTASRPDTTRREQAREWFTLSFRHNGFPSGHSLTAFCAAAILGRGYGAEWLTYPLAAAVAYSRVYNQKHFPADTVAGAGLGWLIGHIVVDLHERRGAGEPGLRFTVLPTEGGSVGVVSWNF